MATENIKDAKIVLPEMAMQSIPDDARDQTDDNSQLLAFAGKLDAIIGANTDILGVLVKIKKDTRGIPSWMKRFSRMPTIATPSPVPSPYKTPGPPQQSTLRKPEKQSAKPSQVQKKQQRKATAIVRLQEKQTPALAVKAPEAKEIKGLEKTPAIAKEAKKKTATRKPPDATPPKTSQTTPKKTDQPKPQKAKKENQTSSQKSLEIRHNEKERIKDRSSILGGIKNAVSGIGAASISTVSEAIQNQDLTDIAGSAVAGPMWGAIKEIKAVTDNTDFGKIKNAKALLTGKKKGETSSKSLPQGAKKDSAGRLRDQRGKYIPKSVGKFTAKTRLLERKNSKNIEDQKKVTERLSELGIQTVESLKDTEKEDVSRHRELLSAVKTVGSVGKAGLIRGGIGKVRGVRANRKARKAKRAIPSRRRSTLRETGGMVERKRRSGATGKIRVPKTGTVSHAPKARGRGKFGKIAGLLSGGLGLGGAGLLGGFFGGESPLDMVSEQALSTVTSKSSEIIASKAGIGATQKSAAGAAAKATPKVGAKLAAKSAGIVSGMAGAGKPATKTASKLGMKGAAKLGMKGAGFGLRALGPLAAVGMAGYDAFQGWNDKDMQAKAFGLKDGQEATTGQKASSSLANVLDMGGLGTGLLSMLGVDADTSDIAKGVHGAGSWIGGALGMTDQKDSEKDIFQKAISAPIATVTEGVKSIWGWITGKDGKKADVIKTATPAASPQAAASTQAQGEAIAKIEPIHSPKVERVKSPIWNEKTGQPGKETGDISNATVKKLIRALEKTVKAPLQVAAGGKPNQQPVVPKTNIKADFDDAMLTLMAYDRI